MPAAKKKSAPAPASDFRIANAPVVVVVAKPSKSSLPCIPIEGVDEYVTLRRFEAVAKSARLLSENSLKESGSARFVNFGVAKGMRPENFVGTEGADSKATFVFSKRSTRSVLTDDQIDLFTEQFGEEWVTANIAVESQPTTYSIPSKYIDDPLWRSRIEQALNTIPDLPADIIVQTPGSTVKTVSDATVNGIFAGRDPEVAARFLPLVTTVGIKPVRSATVSFSALLAKVTSLLEKMQDNLIEAANDPETVLAEDAKRTARRK